MTGFVLQGHISQLQEIKLELESQNVFCNFLYHNSDFF